MDFISVSFRIKLNVSFNLLMGSYVCLGAEELFSFFFFMLRFFYLFVSNSLYILCSYFSQFYLFFLFFFSIYQLWLLLNRLSTSWIFVFLCPNLIYIWYWWLIFLAILIFKDILIQFKKTSVCFLVQMFWIVKIKGFHKVRIILNIVIELLFSINHGTMIEYLSKNWTVE